MASSVATRLCRYFLTAGTASIIDVGGFALLRLVDLPVAAAAVASFCVAAMANYLLSSWFAFNRQPSLIGGMLFFAAATGGLVFNVTATIVGSQYLGLVPVLAKLVGVGTAFLINFWINYRFVYGLGHATLHRGALALAKDGVNTKG